MNQTILPITVDDKPFDYTQSLGEFYYLYMSEAGVRLKTSTIECKQRIMAQYVLPYLGDVPLCKLTSKHIRAWQNRLIRDYSFSQGYLGLIDRHFASVLNYGKRMYDMISPFDKAGHIGCKNNGHMNIWSVDDFHDFIGYFSNDIRLKSLFETLYWGGLRIGEVLALTPNDILKNPKEIRVCKAMSLSHGVDFVSTPKTSKSNRQVSIPDFVYDDIQNCILSHNIGKHDWIYAVSRTYVRKYLRRACDITGVPTIRIHDLRHSHVSLLISMGFSPVLIADRVGHEKVSTTLNTYAHLFPKQKVDLIRKLEKINSKW